MKAKTTVYKLKTIHPFGISRGTSSEYKNLFLELEGGGVGEGAPVRYYNQTVEEAIPLVEKMVEEVTPENVFDLDRHAKRAKLIAPKHSAARTAFDLALHDRVGRELGVPLYKLMGFSYPENAVSSYTIGLDTDEKMIVKTREARELPQLKIKLGRDDAEVDARTLRAICKEAVGKTIRIDANAGWSLGTAIRMAKVCADLGIEFLEQPLAIGDYEGLARLKKESPLPIVVDEDVQDLASLPPLLGKIDGINIKLMKCGGLWEARQMIGFARANGWSIMLGCMIESTVGIAAAAHLAGVAQDLDLDTELLVGNNPCSPIVMGRDGIIRPSHEPGLGVTLNLASPQPAS